jgi:hypothetical protein
MLYHLPQPFIIMKGVVARASTRLRGNPRGGLNSKINLVERTPRTYISGFYNVQIGTA